MNANVENIRNTGMRVIRGRVPAEIRKILNAAVKEGLLKHLKKDHLKPEIYCHPDNLQAAKEAQIKEAMGAIENIKKVMIIE